MRGPVVSRASTGELTNSAIPAGDRARQQQRRPVREPIASDAQQQVDDRQRPAVQSTPVRHRIQTSREDVSSGVPLRRSEQQKCPNLAGGTTLEGRREFPTGLQRRQMAWPCQARPGVGRRGAHAAANSAAIARHSRSAPHHRRANPGLPAMALDTEANSEPGSPPC